MKELFQIGATRTDPCLLPLMSGEILVLKDEMQVCVSLSLFLCGSVKYVSLRFHSSLSSLLFPFLLLPLLCLSFPPPPPCVFDHHMDLLHIISLSQIFTFFPNPSFLSSSSPFSFFPSTSSLPSSLPPFLPSLPLLLYHAYRLV